MISRLCSLHGYPTPRLPWELGPDICGVLLKTEKVDGRRLLANGDGCKVIAMNWILKKRLPRAWPTSVLIDCLLIAILFHNLKMQMIVSHADNDYRLSATTFLGLSCACVGKLEKGGCARRWRQMKKRYEIKSFGSY